MHAGSSGSQKWRRQQVLLLPARSSKAAPQWSCGEPAAGVCGAASLETTKGTGQGLIGPAWKGPLKCRAPIFGALPPTTQLGPGRTSGVRALRSRCSSTGSGGSSRPSAAAAAAVGDGAGCGGAARSAGAARGGRAGSQAGRAGGAAPAAQGKGKAMQPAARTFVRERDGVLALSIVAPPRLG